MGRHTWTQWLVINGAAALLLQGFALQTASADDADVARRLGKYGKLSSAETRKVVSTVSSRMKRAADMTNDDDPLRVAVTRALYGRPVAGDVMKAAKVRLRLYAGLNDWALENLFSPRPGAIANCTSQFGLNEKSCEALIAASGQVALSDASRLGAGKPIGNTQAASPYRGNAQARTQQNPRFGRFNSGYRAGQPAQAAQQQRPTWTAQRPAPAARPAARPTAARPVAPPASAQSVAARKAEYQRKRQEYLARKREEMEARKNKVVAVAAGERIQRGPASVEEAEAAGLDPAAARRASSSHSAPVASKGAPKVPAAKAAPAQEVAQAPAEAPSKQDNPALDNSFLEGLLDDPLGGK